MKEATGITWIFQIVILFILLFTAIMALTINNSNAFGVKDEIVNAIEYSKGNFLDDGNLIADISDKIQATSYRTTGKCKDGFQGYDRTGKAVESNESAAVCIRAVEVNEGINNYLTDNLCPAENKLCFATNDFYKGVYYQVQVFYQLDLPIINQVYNFSTMGETKVIYGE